MTTEQLPDSNASRLKAEFVNLYRGNGHVRETLPDIPSRLGSADKYQLKRLHDFARKNPIYYNSYKMTILDVPCTVYEGDINEYWISSTKHDVSNQPFYPTWILSAYEAVLEAKRHGARQIIDIGSGDGRIAYCAGMLGMDAHGIEIDTQLSDLQRRIIKETDTKFNVWHADANEFKYEMLNLTKPAFFIGGLPEMGEMLARSILSKILADELLERESIFVFMGSFQLKKFTKSTKKWGWGFVIDESDLAVKSALVLPTCWTMDQQKDTPYIFTKKD